MEEYRSLDKKSSEDGDERRRKDEYDDVKVQVKRLLFGLSCTDCIAKRRKGRIPTAIWTSSRKHRSAKPEGRGQIPRCPP